MIQNYMERINAFIDENREQMMKDWETFVRIEDCFDEKENVERAMAWLKAKYDDMGFDCHVEAVGDDNYAGTLCGIWGAEYPGKPLLFIGHIDTVQPSGSFGENPFVIRDGNVYGPGVLDMKGGQIMMLYVIRALQMLGFDERPIKICFSGDEEYNHVTTTGADIVKREATGALCAFNMESGNLDNCLTVQRKTSNSVRMHVYGKGGHAGNDFLNSGNSINEAARKIIDMMSITDLEKGLYMNTSIIKGGNGNCAIPEHCEVLFNIRLPSTEDAELLQVKVEQIMGRTYIAGTRTEYTIERSQLPAYKKNEQIHRLLSHVNNIAVENGFKAFGEKGVAGASDSGNVMAVGVPVRCACGVRGKYHHSPNEYAVIDSLFERAKIFAAAAYTIARFEEA